MKETNKKPNFVFYSDKKWVSFLMLFIFLICSVAIAFFSLRTLVATKGSDIFILNLIFITPAFVISFIISVLTIIVLFSLTSMRYELRDDALYLIIGPWKSKISYNEIIEVVHKDLSFSPLSSFRLPGIALFDVDYSDEGIVRMYSTHALKDIVLIKTAKKKYGISPKDKSEFMDALLEKTGKRREHLHEEIAKENVEEVKSIVSEPKRWTTFQISSFAVTLICIILTLIYYPHLPKTIAIHWDILGIPNGYMVNLLGVSVVPAIMILLFVFPFLIPGKLGVFKTNWYKVIILSLLALLFGQIYILLWNTGTQINGKIFFPIVFIIIVISVLMSLKLFSGKNLTKT